MTATIKAEFDSDDAERQPVLERARQCAAHTIPSVLPPAGMNEQQRLPETYQSLGARGVANLENRLLTAIHPPGTPWFRFGPSIEVKHRSGLSPEQVTEIETHLYVRELIVQSHLDATGYRNRKRVALRQLIVTGNALSRLTDEYKIKNYRLDQYVAHRDPCGQILYVITKEMVDPLSLPQEMLAQANVTPDKYQGKVRRDRLIELYTRAEWQPREKAWVVEQEINGVVVNASDEQVSPFFVSRYDELPGEHYGRGLVEMNMGDLRSFNGNCQAIVDWSAAASRLLVAVDDSGTTNIKDVAEKPNGSVIRGRVRDGKIQDIGFLTMDKFADFQVTKAITDTIEKRLGKAMMLETEMQPTGERVTAYQVARIARELEGTLGGVYAAIAEDEQRPFLDRVIYQMERDSLLPPLPKDAVEVQVLTGLEALGRENELGKLMGAVQTLAQLGPEAIARINMETVAARVLSLTGIDPTGLIKSDEQVERERRAAAMAQLQAAAGMKAIDTTGNIVEAAATQGGAAPAQAA